MSIGEKPGMTWQSVTKKLIRLDAFMLNGQFMNAQSSRCAMSAPQSNVPIVKINSVSELLRTRSTAHMANATSAAMLSAVNGNQ